MAEDIRKTAILEFEVDQTQAKKQLVQTEKNIISLKKEQADLNKEYKEGKISEDKYIESNLKLQRAIKSETSQKQSLNKLLETESNSRNAMRIRVAELNKEYNNLNKFTDLGKKRAAELQKELSDLNAELNEGSKAAGQFKDNIGNYPEQFAEATNSVKPFGISVGDATSSMSKFLTPTTAAIGVLAALGTAYASSSAGAKDLAFAQDRLSFITSSLVESLGELISGTGEGGEGALNQLIDGVIDFSKTIPEFAIAQALFTAATGKTVDQINAQSKALALAREELRKLEIESARAQGFAKFFENAAENARRLRDDEERTLEQRLQSSGAVEQNLTANATVRLNVLNKEIEAIKAANVNWQNQDNIVLQIEQKRAETRDIEEEINGKLTENVTARKAILNEINALARAERRQQGAGPEAVPDVLQGAFSIGELGKEQELEITERFNKRIVQAEEEKNAQILADARRTAEGQAQIQQVLADAQVNAAGAILGAVGSVFEQQSDAYKAFATAQTLISTYATAQQAYAAAFVPPTIASPALGAINVAVAITQGLANLAAIHGVQFTEGGYTGPGTKYQPAGVVHAGEVVWSQADVAAAGGPAVANAMRPTMRGYADGGFVTQQNVSASQQALITANAIKNLPPSVVSWTEGRAVGRRVEIREQTARI